ncbi:MAG: cytochrome c oxidase subunit II [Deltaproteobacteria bacterium]
MNWLPVQASEFAGRIDSVIWFVTIISLISFVLVTFGLVYFAIKYRRRSENDETPAITGSHFLETLWTVIPSILVMIVFVYGLVIFQEMRVPPKEATDVSVIAKQWLWQFQYDNGRTTINELYVQQNRPVRMVMRTEDVLHSFYVPAFRVKQDLVGGMYTQLWFTPTKVGIYDMYCAEYCGTGHSTMLAKVVVMSPEAFERWDKGEEAVEGQLVADVPPEQLGEKLYTNRGCNACHSIDGSVGVGPSLKGLFGKTETMVDDEQMAVDENYLNQSILEPQAKMVKGFAPVMPSFKGILSDKEVAGLIAYIKTLK